MGNNPNYGPVLSRQPDGDDDAVRRFRDAVLSDLERQDSSGVVRQNWFLVPFEIAPQVDTRLARSLCQLGGSGLLQSGSDPLFAVPVKPVPTHEGGLGDVVVRLPSTAELLEEWAVRESWADWVITTKACEFALICYGVYNYNLVLGPREIVEFVIRGTVEEAIDGFERFARAYDYAPDDALHDSVLNLARAALTHGHGK